MTGRRHFASYNPRRLIGVSVIPMYDVAWAIEELERTLQKGLLNPMINCQAPEGCPPYRDPVYDRFWAAASEAGAPVTLHLLTGRVLSPLGGAADQTPVERQENPAQWIALFNEIQTVLANDFIFGGILERFPNLKLVCSEYEVAWIPGFHDPPGPDRRQYHAFSSPQAEDARQRLHADAGLARFH